MAGMLKILEDLSNSYGVSGMEHEVRKKIMKYIKPHVDSTEIDRMGNLICHKKGSYHPIMLAAHMDEIGLVARDIDDLGHIFFSLVGGLGEDTLLGQEVHIMAKGKLHGVITYEDMHTGREAPDKIPHFQMMHVDTGLSKKELARKGVSVGTYMIPERKFRVLGRKNIISGKALDDRIGCAILIELARRIKKNRKANIFFVFTVQEEMGLYGAQTSAYSIEPVWAAAVDVIAANDFKGERRGLGYGPAITVKDLSFIANQNLVSSFVKSAKSLRMPYQLEVSDFGTTDALTISLSKGGIPAGVIGVTIRNIHSTVGIADMNDIESTIRLLEGIVKKPPASCIT